MWLPKLFWLATHGVVCSPLFMIVFLVECSRFKKAEVMHLAFSYMLGLHVAYPTDIE